MAPLTRRYECVSIGEANNNRRVPNYVVSKVVVQTYAVKKRTAIGWSVDSMEDEGRIQQRGAEICKKTTRTFPRETRTGAKKSLPLSRINH
jgi:hypothetical protein